MANDFSGDSDVVALYNFESGALSDDSKNSNDLTAYGSPAADTTNYKQGSASVDLDSSSSQYFDIDDADMSSDFPLKSGTTNDTFSVLGWIYPTSASAREGFVSKYDSVSNTRSCAIRRESDGSWSVLLGWNSGESYEYAVQNEGSSDEDQWYHIKFTYDDQDWTLRIWGETEDDTVVDTSGTATNAISVTTEPWDIGQYNGGYNLDGNLDEVIFFKRVVSDSDQDDIIDGTYSTGGGTTYNETIAETMSMSDSSAAGLIIRATIAESMGMGDSTTPALTMPLTIAEVLALSDSIDSTAILNVTINETLGLSDNVYADGQVIDLVINETISLSDSSAMVNIINAAISEGVLFSDSAESTIDISITIDEALSLIDQLSLAANYNLTITEGLSLIDAISSGDLVSGQLRICIGGKSAAISITCKSGSITITGSDQDAC